MLFRIVKLSMFLISLTLASSRGSQVVFMVADRNTGKPLPCQIYLKDKTGKPVQAEGLPFWHDHFVSSGHSELKLSPGQYTYEIDRGPEYFIHTGSFLVTEEAVTKVAVKLERFVNMSGHGWWSGDFHVHRPASDIELLMQAADLHIAPVITWWNNKSQWANRQLTAQPLVSFDKNRYYHLLAGEDEREGGALLYFNLTKPLAITEATREFPSPLEFLAEARKYKGVWVDVEKPFWWDVPLWLASGQVDSIGLANNHMCRDSMHETEAWGKPRDMKRLEPPRGNGFWTQEIYYHLLNCGLRIPPSAGSASGVLPNPVGYNRVYVYLGKSPSYGQWWEGLRAGRCFVSNGPLLMCQANERLPGHVFMAKDEKALKIEIQGFLTTRDPISSIEVIKNGKVEYTVPFEKSKKPHKLAVLGFKESGWFLVRAITDNPKTFRFASTAPYYVEIGDTKRRISRSSAQFFLNWARERAARIQLDDPIQKEKVTQYHTLAEKFWIDLLAKANAD
ncbi:MAG: CehA/McbA family metallohydrolase [Acidobacteria bacterium]|nr:CehA/McbA family metallohydrolase [Acidobacteriota bacterium]MCI0723935.1 CehA/McbA family metallohydrolase [Acidobacteriota bacterium]